jgi:hypothetical protein
MKTAKKLREKNIINLSQLFVQAPPINSIIELQWGNWIYAILMQIIFLNRQNRNIKLKSIQPHYIDTQFASYDIRINQD